MHDVAQPQPKTTKVRIDDVSGVCDDNDGPVVHLLDELAAGLGTLAELATHSEWEGKPPHVLIYALERKARGALRLLGEATDADVEGAPRRGSRLARAALRAVDKLHHIDEELETLEDAISAHDETTHLQASLFRTRIWLGQERDKLDEARRAKEAS